MDSEGVWVAFCRARVFFVWLTLARARAACRGMAGRPAGSSRGTI